MPAIEHDVVVFGAGPAGTAAAIRLAELGFDVAIVERSRFPRDHVGICVGDETSALIELLGAAEGFAGLRFWRCDVTAVNWGDATEILTRRPGYHVDRGAFDTLMLDRAKCAGVQVYQPARVSELIGPTNAGWRALLSLATGSQSIGARFVIDATGRRSTIPGARIKDGPPLLAIHAMWVPSRDDAVDGLIEAGDNAWLWYARNAPDSAMVSVFCDPRHLKTNGRGDLASKYREMLDRFNARRLLDRQISLPRACDASSHHAADPVGASYIRLGDSCFCVDPLSSQGVHLALQSGLLGAIIVNTILRKPAYAETAKVFLHHRVAGHIARFSMRTKQEYGRVVSIFSSSFWTERCGDKAVQREAFFSAEDRTNPINPFDAVAISPNVSFDIEPVIEGDFIEVRRTLRHPSLESSIRYVAGVEIITLLNALPKRCLYNEIPAIWERRVPSETSSKIAEFLRRNEILVRVA